jgi:hypothetical protein
MFHRNIPWVEIHVLIIIHRSVGTQHALNVIMPNTYTQIHIHFVFAVKYRASLIDAEWKERLQQYFVWMKPLYGVACFVPMERMYM